MDGGNLDENWAGEMSMCMSAEIGASRSNRLFLEHFVTDLHASTLPDSITPTSYEQ